MEKQKILLCGFLILSIFTCYVTLADAAPAPFPKRGERLPCPPPKGNWSGHVKDQDPNDHNLTLSIYDCDLEKGSCNVSLGGSNKFGTTYELKGTLTFQNKTSMSGDFSLSGIRVFQNGLKVEDNMSGAWSISRGTLTLKDDNLSYVFTRMVKTSCDAEEQPVHTETFIEYQNSFISLLQDNESCGCEEIGESESSPNDVSKPALSVSVETSPLSSETHIHTLQAPSLEGSSELRNDSYDPRYNSGNYRYER